MTGQRQPQLFRPRSLIGSDELNWAHRRLAMVDAHHVAITHGTHGITDGLVVSVENAGLALRISAGAAYTPYGDLLELCEDVVLPPPSQSGLYAISMTDAGVIRVDLGQGRPAWIRLGTSTALPNTYGTSILWGEFGNLGRHLAGAAARAHVAAGAEQFTLAAFDNDEFFGSFSYFVPTINGQFERTPIYFASISVRQNGAPLPVARTTVNGVRGWYIEVCDPSPSGFTGQLHAGVAPHLLDDLSQVPDDVDVTLSWLGVDHRRPGPDPTNPDVIHADHDCYLPPPPHEPDPGPF